MKRKLLFAVMTLITGAWSLSVNAQSWTPSPVGAGQFYLYNVGAEAYMVPGNNWGTRASVNPIGGTTLTLAVSGDGYTISTAPLFTNRYLGQDGYMDNGTAFAWVFEPVSGETNVYKMKRNSDYFFADAGATTTSIGADPGTDYAKWKLVSKADRIADLANASETNPKDATFLITCPNFDRNANTGVWSMEASNKNLSGGNDNNRCAESWRATFTLSQTLSGLPNGYYQVRAQAALTDYDNVGTNFPYVYAAEQTADFNLMQHGENGMGQLSDRFLAGEYWTNWTASTIVANGSLTIGAKNNRNNTWSIWDNFQLRYLGAVTDLSAYEELLANTVAAANALEGKIPTAAYNALNAVVTAQNQTYSTADEYTDAIAAINTAINTYGSAALQSNYAEYKALKATIDANAAITVTADTQSQQTTNASALTSAMSPIISAVEAVTTDASAITAQFSAMKAAGVAYVNGLTPSDPDNAPFDVTFMIVNPTIEGITGWTVSRPNGGNGPLLNGTSMEYWAGNANGGRDNGQFDYYQIITSLPNGTYRVSAEMYNSLNNEEGAVFSATSGVYGSANNEEYTLVDVDGTTLLPYTTGDITTTDGNLRIGVKSVNTPMGARWFVADNFKLYMTGSVDIQAYIDAWTAALTAARATAATNQKMANRVLTNLNTVISENDEEHVDQTSQAELEAATAALIAANELGQKSINSYAVIAQGSVPDNSLEGWTCETFVPGQDVRFQVNTWSHEGDPGNDPSGMVTPFIENWTPNGNLLGAGKVYYRLEGLEPGEVYRVEALVRSYNEASADAPNGPNFYVLDDVADLTEVGTTFTYNNMSGIYGTQVAAATIGQDGVLELGVIVAANCNYNWVAFKNIRITTFDAAYDAAVASVQALSGTVPAAVYTTAAASIPATRPTTADGFMTAIDAMEAAVTEANTYVTPYEAWNTARSDAVVALGNNTTFNTIITNLTNDVEAATTVETVTNATAQLNEIAVPAKAYLELKDYADALVLVESDDDTAQQDLSVAIGTAETDIETATTAAEIEAVNAALKAAMIDYATIATPTDGNKFDLTFMLTNPDLTPFYTGGHNVHPDGWATEQADGNYQVIPSEDAANPDGIHKYCYEYWSETAKDNGIFNLYTTVENLPVGTYQMSCYAFASPNNVAGATNNQVYFYANDTQGSPVTSEVLALQNVEFVNNSTQDVKIGLKSLTGNQYRWMGIGYVQLFKVPAQAYEVGGDEWNPATEGAGDVTIARSINAALNAVVFPFSMTQAEVETYFGEGSTVKIVKSFNSEREHLSFETREGIQANQPCLLKATQASAAGTITVPERTIVPATVLTDNNEVTYSGDEVVMYGCYAEETFVPNYGLFVQGGKLVYNEGTSHPQGAGFVYATRGYIVLNGWTPGANGIKGLTIDFDDEATGIAVVENGELKVLDGQAYDLSGRAVKNPTKGLYIIGGKKVFLK